MRQDWEKWGADIRNIVQDAVDSRDFQRLNETISNTVNDAVFQLRETILRGAGQRETFQGAPVDMGEFPLGAVEKPRELFAGKRGAKVLSVAAAAGGFLLAAGSALALTVFVLRTVTVGVVSVLAGLSFAALSLGLTAGSILAIWGVRSCGRIDRYQEYIRALRGRMYCNIAEIAQVCGKKKKRVQKDLRSMIRKGWFRQGHLDDEGECLMVSDRTYREYREILRQRREQQRAEQQRAAAQTGAEENAEAGQVREKGRWYIEKIRACNDAIPGEAISRKIERIEFLVSRIFARVEKEPSAVEDIRKLMEYYLPTTIKLLEAYEQLDAQPETGENIRQAKAEIEKTLDTLNVAFEKLLDSLFEEVAWDVSSDISALETILAQEGLTDDGMKGREARWNR